jgi:hypothetical protein
MRARSPFSNRKNDDADARARADGSSGGGGDGPHAANQTPKPTTTRPRHPSRRPCPSSNTPKPLYTPQNNPQNTPKTTPKTNKNKRLIAHGKKVGRARLAGVRLAQICDAVLSPNVPHSLRLQGILVGGICVVFQRQQAYLLGECFCLFFACCSFFFFLSFACRTLKRKKNARSPLSLFFFFHSSSFLTFPPSFLKNQPNHTKPSNRGPQPAHEAHPPG